MRHAVQLGHHLFRDKNCFILESLTVSKIPLFVSVSDETLQVLTHPCVHHVKEVLS